MFPSVVIALNCAKTRFWDCAKSCLMTCSKKFTILFVSACVRTSAIPELAAWIACIAASKTVWSLSVICAYLNRPSIRGYTYFLERIEHKSTRHS